MFISNACNDFGKSIFYPISFENRFIILPDGFVSKKRIVAEMTPVNIVLCNFCEARTAISKNAIDRESAITNSKANNVP